MHRLTDADLRDRIRPVLARYTPDALKHLPRDRLIAEIVAELQGLEIIGFRRPAFGHVAGGTDPATRAAHARAMLNAEALERVAREAVAAILAVVECGSVSDPPHADNAAHCLRPQRCALLDWSSAYHRSGEGANVARARSTDMNPEFRPVNNDHAIERVSFTLQFDTPFTAADTAKFRTQHHIWVSDLPAVRVPAGFLLTVDGGQGVQVNATSGIEFCIFRPDGSAVWSMQFRGAELVVECSRYTRWDRVSAFAYRQIERALRLMNELPPRRLARVILTVQDAFRTEDGEGDIRQLLMPSDLLPVAAFSRGPNWHVHTGWFEKGLDDARVLVNLNIDSVMEQQEGASSQRRRLGVTNAFFADYIGDSPMATDSIMAWLQRVMADMHDCNKRLLGELLVPAVIDRIGLQKGKSE